MDSAFEIYGNLKRLYEAERINRGFESFLNVMAYAHPIWVAVQAQDITENFSQLKEVSITLGHHDDSRFNLVQTKLEKLCSVFRFSRDIKLIERSNDLAVLRNLPVDGEYFEINLQPNKLTLKVYDLNKSECSFFLTKNDLVSFLDNFIKYLNISI